MNNTELSLLLFLETRAVDYGGIVDNRHMNAGDFEITKEWNASGFLEFRRIKSSDITMNHCTHFVKLSEEAWVAAHAERRARCERIMERRAAEKAAKEAKL